MATAVKKTAKGAAGGSKKTVGQRAAEIREEMKEAYDLGYRHGYAAGERLPDSPGVKAAAQGKPQGPEDPEKSRREEVTRHEKRKI